MSPSVSLGRAHEVGLFLATTTSYLIVLVGGEFPKVTWLVLATPIVSAALKTVGRAAPAGSGTALGVASLALGTAQIVSAGIDTAVLGGGIALVGLLTARLITRQTLDHDLQALLLSLLLVLAGSVLNVGINYGIFFVLYALSAVWALTTRQLLAGAEQDGVGDRGASARAVRSRRDVVTPRFLVATGSVALFVLATTGVVFFLFPRFGVGNVGLSSDRTGNFPNAVSLRGAPRASVGTNDVVARVSGLSRDDFLRGLYLRGGVYDVVDQGGFSQASRPPALKGASRKLADGPAAGAYQVYLTPVAGELLFSLGRVVNARVLQGGRANPLFRARVEGSNRRSELISDSRLQSAVRYVVRGPVSAPGFVPEDRAEHIRLPEEGLRFFLSLPEDLDSRIPGLVESLTAGVEDDAERAARVREYFFSTYTYTLEQPSGGADQPLVDFLFVSLAGHCEYFAAAYAVLLRQAGIPARVVGGYQGGQWDEDAETVVFTGRNAHAWVEWWLPGAGWVTDDPTPAASSPRESLSGLSSLVERVRRFWDDTVLDYALSNQMKALRTTQSFFSRLSFDTDPKTLLPVGGVTVAAVAAVWWLRRLRRRRRKEGGSVDPLALSLVAALGRLGRSVGEERTLREVASTLEPGEAKSVVLEVLALYERHRFGGAPLDTEQREKAQARLQQLGATSGAGR